MNENDLKMYGCYREYIDHGIENMIVPNPMMYALSVLSDAQEIMKMDPETARQYINKAKYVMANEMRKGA
jgi:hypothetical protein